MREQSPISQRNERRLSIRDFVGYLAELVALIGAIIYTSGFVIVNAYLSQKGVSNVRILHPAFVPAGLLFLVLTLWSIGTSISIFLIMNAERESKRFAQIKGKGIISTMRNLFRKARNKLNKSKLIIYFGRIVFAIIVLISASELLSNILSLASPQRQIDSIDLTRKIRVLITLQGIFSIILVSFNYRIWKSIVVKNQFYLPILSALIIILLQLYSMFYVAGQIYGNLPPSIGGGAPDKVILYIAENEKPYFDSLAIHFCPLGVEGNDARVYATSSTIWLFWQFSDERRFGRSGDAPTAILYISTDISTKPIIAVQGEKVLAMTFLTDELQVC